MFFFRVIPIVILVFLVACASPQQVLECQTDADCMVGGCSGQLCGSVKDMQDIVTTCEWKDEYACYKLTNCLCIENKCNWKETPEFLACKTAGGIVEKPKLIIVPQKEGELDLKRQCAYVGGLWKKFPDGCADSCIVARMPDEIGCTQAITSSCDCGPTKCWNGESCEDN